MLPRSCSARAAGAVLLAFTEGMAQPVPAQTEDSREARLPPVTVTGVRASVISAQQIRRDHLGIVDAVVADDIVRLPDHSVADALQRVAGVQITRDRGEGGVVVIRGLTQMETLLNGREVFTAGTGRALDFSDIPAEMISAVHVHKTSSADQLEGGLGGTIDLRTRRPFDFAGREVALSARVVHGDLVRKAKPQVSLLASDRWSLGAGGELGALISLSHQRRAYREDQKSSGTPRACNDTTDNGTAGIPACPELVPGRTVYAPNATSETRSIGERQRTGLNAVLQWRPSPALELYAEGSFAQFKTIQDSYQINASIGANTGFQPGSVELFPGTDDVRRVTWTNVPVSVLSFARDTVDRTRQFALGGSWKPGDAWQVKSDLSHTQSFSHLFFSGPTLSATAAAFTHDVSSRVPGTSVSGTDLLDPANFTFVSSAYRVRPFEGSLTAWRIDAEHDLGMGIAESVSVGLRLARRRADNGAGLTFGDASVPGGLPAANRPDLVMPNPYGFMPGEDSTSLRDFLAGNLALARDPVALRTALGITGPLPSGGSPLSLWRFDERTYSAYVSTDLKAPRMPLDGRVGVRVVRTHEGASGFQSVPSAGGVAPLEVDSRYTDWLPSLSLRYAVEPGLALRAAAAKTITRPNFDQLSPSLSLLRNSVDPSLNQGLSGNPALEPVRAANVDLAVERYFGDTTAVLATVFWKKVDGFATTVSRDEVHDGETYRVSRPVNTSRGKVTGVELGYQQFYDGLPGAWSGLGLQANYTYVDGKTVLAGTGELPLQNLSRHSLNLIGMYEKGPVSARLAYNWRDRYFSGLTGVVGVGSLPSYVAAYGWLDASLRWRWNERVTFAVEGTNLLRTLRHSYYETQTRRQHAWLNDRQISMAVTVRLH